MCLPADAAAPAACASTAAPGSEPCSGAQLLAARLRWIGDQLEKRHRTKESGSGKDAPGSRKALLRGLCAVCAAVHLAAAAALLLGRRHL